MKSVSQVVQERGLRRPHSTLFVYHPGLKEVGILRDVEGVPVVHLFKEGEVHGALCATADLIVLPRQEAVLTPVLQLRRGDVAIVDAGPCYVKSIVASEPPAVVLVNLEGDELRVSPSDPANSGLHVVRPVDPTVALPALGTPDLKPMGLLNTPQQPHHERTFHVVGCTTESPTQRIGREVHSRFFEIALDASRSAYSPLMVPKFLHSGGFVGKKGGDPVVDLGSIEWCGVERRGTLGLADEYGLTEFVPLRGAKHQEAAAQQCLLGLAPTNRLTFVRDPHNPADPNAIGVFRKDRRTRREYRVGFVPRELAKELAPLMDRGVELQGAMRTRGVLGYDECLMDLRLRVPHSLKVKGVGKAMGLGDVFTHPKHQGKTVAQVLFDDPGYVVWMVEQGFIEVGHEVEAALKKALR